MVKKTTSKHMMPNMPMKESEMPMKHKQTAKKAGRKSK